MNVQYDNVLSVTDYNILRTSAGWGTIPPHQAEVGLSRSELVIAAKEEGRTVGMSRIVSDGGCAVFIVDVIVLPEYQRKGIGKAMLERIMEYLNGKMSSGEVLHIGLMAAKGKEEFYKKFGFEYRPNDHAGPGMTQWLRRDV